MVYFILRKKENETVWTLCIVRADSAKQAKVMVGVDEHHGEYGCCTIDELSAMLNTKEGYITKQL